MREPWVVFDKAVIFDIETAPTAEGLAALLSHPPEFNAPSHYKDEAKIAAYIVRMRQEWERKTIESAAKAPHTGRVTCFGYWTVGTETPVVRASTDEKELLEIASIALAGSVPVTFFGDNFDIPFLITRMLRYRIQLPFDLLSHGGRIDSIDLHSILCGFSSKGFNLSLKDVCFALGVEYETDIDGKDCPCLFEQGRLDELAKKCEADVRAMYEIFMRIAGKDEN